jgi:hypothetical protein
VHLVEWYFEQCLPLVGRYDMPLISQQDVVLSDLQLIRYSNTVKAETRHTAATVHFLEDDKKFDEVWNDPAAHVPELAQYRQVLSPDFSLWMDMPVMLQLVNTLRNRWCGAYWQSRGMTVIPTVSWSGGKSFDFCFAGIEVGSVVSVSTVGCRDVPQAFMRGYGELFRVVRPEVVVCYGEPFDEMWDYGDLVVVPYVRDQRIAERLPGNG